jgi:hypothetical protein
MNQNEDTLRDRLHEEATAERPPFSPELHQRIMRNVRNPQRLSLSSWRIKPSRWLVAAAAAICFSAGALSIIRLVISHRTSVPGPPAQIAIIPPTVTPSAPTASIPLNLNVGGILSARLWPPELAMRLPISGVGHLPPAEQLPAPSYDPPGSPEWLFARLQQPAISAQMALADTIPPDMRALAGLAKLRQ